MSNVVGMKAEGHHNVLEGVGLDEVDIALSILNHSQMMNCNHIFMMKIS